MSTQQISNMDHLATTNNLQNKSNGYNGELNIIDLILVLWRHKWFIAVCSIIPPLLTGLLLYFSPRNYKISYLYDVRSGIWKLNEINYRILLNRFYSVKNLDKILFEFNENGMIELSELLKKNKDGLKKIVEFEVLPPYPDVSKMRNLNSERIEQFRLMTASVLSLTINGKTEKNFGKLYSIIRANFENVVPLYMIAESLKSSIRDYQSKMSGIEKNRFELQLKLKTQLAILNKIKTVDTRISGKYTSDTTLQFDVGNKSEFLPLSHQITAIESMLINLEEASTNYEIKYRYYNSLLKLNTKLLYEVEEKFSNRYTIQEFRNFLLTILHDVNEQELKDYLNSYIKIIDNSISLRNPITVTPLVIPVPKGTIKTSAVIFIISIMLSLLTAFLIEGLKKRNLK